MEALRPLDARLAENTKNARTLAAVVLAAGKGKRLKSSTPKVLHPICGRPALWHVLHGVLATKPNKIVVVVGHGADDVRAAVQSWGLKPAPVFVEQAEQLGTGHAVLEAEQAVGRAQDVIVVGGDFDPVTGDDLKRLVSAHRRNAGAAAIFVTELDEPGGYARVVHERGRLVAIVEGTDAPAALRASKLVSPLIMVFRRTDLFRALPAVGRENRQSEYYLNEVLPILIDKGERVSVVPVDTGGTFGVNSRGGLAAVERVVRDRINATHMDNGVTIVDPNATYIDVDVTIGRDTVIRPMTFLEGETRIGAERVDRPVHTDRRLARGRPERGDVRGGPGLDDRQGRPGRDRSSGCVRGPCSRTGPRRGRSSTSRTSRSGKRSKVPHLSYVGDADIGTDVNVGAGTVTVNFDGYEKHRTVIGDGASIGSDTMLIAPVTIGKDANTGAGSVITKDVPAGALAVERAEQRNVEGYRKRKDAEHRRTAEAGEAPAEKRNRPKHREELRGSAVEIITKKRMMLFTGTIHPDLGGEIADCLGIPLSESEIRRFANTELYFRAKESVRGADCFIVQTHYEPVNEAIMEQLIMIDAMKRASAKRITAVIPYYGYSRQDHKALSREPISAKLVADMLTVAGADRIISVDLHSGQIQGYFDAPFDHLTALPILSDYLENTLGLHGDDLVSWRRTPAASRPPRSCASTCTRTWRSSTSGARRPRRTRSRRWRSSVRSTAGRACWSTT